MKNVMVGVNFVGICCGIEEVIKMVVDLLYVMVYEVKM